MVIAILAAISITAYTGITDRAEVTRVSAEAKSWESALRLYRISAGISFYDGYNAAYPATPLTPNSCLGESLPAKDGFAANSCAYNLATNNQESGVNTQAMAHLAQVAGISLPKGNTPYANVSYGVPGGETWKVRSVLYSPDAGGGEVIHYYLQGDKSCGGYSKMYASADNSTRCSKDL